MIFLKVKEYLKTHFLKNQQRKFLFFIFTYFVKEVFNFFFNIYSFLRDREKQSVSGEGAEREGDTETESGSRL